MSNLSITNHLVRAGWGRFLFVWLYVWDRDSCSPNCPQTLKNYFELLIPLTPPPNFWDYRIVIPHLVYEVLRMESNSLRMLGKHSTKWAPCTDLLLLICQSHLYSKFYISTLPSLYKNQSFLHLTKQMNSMVLIFFKVRFSGVFCYGLTYVHNQLHLNKVMMNWRSSSHLVMPCHEKLIITIRKHDSHYSVIFNF